ncbi:Protocadherin gamma-A1 [Paragonimus heterotremus]|uniref:Protocadherin gamma-A1 n=1 Tax=Paragonimus heterotremus TaxID=100268 RepID=A0A8J4TP61_9TREM|nr:Protocadherin gamma-A1 [Paragonimus heterotremus]
MESPLRNWHVFISFLFLFCRLPNQLMADLSTVQYRIRYAITENQPEDLRIGKLDEDLLQTPEIRQSELFNLLQTSKSGMIRYQLRESSQYFRLNEQTSVLSTTTSIDLETLCPRYCREGATRGQLNLFISIGYESRLLALLHVEVTVIDVDDNPPQFPVTVPRPYVLQFKEVIYRSGQQIELPKAVDLDVQPDHAEIAYRLKAHPEDQSHALDVFKLLTRNDSRLMLVLQQDLDYETVKLYRFYLVAYSPRLDDRGRKHYISPPQPNFKDQLEIRVEVLNINDIEPVFPQAVYNVQLPEDTSVGTVIYTLKAIDRDENATIIYSMESGLNMNTNDMFEVESDGRVILVQSLDYEKQTKYALTVRASDGEFYALTRLDVIVTDMNDELPEFVTNPSALTVEENQPGQTPVGQLFIKDRDSPEVNGQVSCHEPKHLVSRQPLLFYPEVNRHFGGPSLPANSDLNSNNGAIMTPSRSSETQVYQQFSLLTRIKFDREVDPHVYESLLICVDGQSLDDGSEVKMKQLTTTLTISLTVTDQNDNLPVFEKQHYEAELRENCPIGTKVIQVSRH